MKNNLNTSTKYGVSCKYKYGGRYDYQDEQIYNMR